jgi:hypothetical protein
VLAGTGRGPIALLGLLLVVVVAAPVSAVGVAAALLATTWRWSSGWLGPIGAAQAVLGTGLVVGPAVQTASGLAAATALLLATPKRSIPASVALAVTAAFVVAGPAGASSANTRVLATGACLALALAVAWAPGRRPWVVAAGVAGLLALVLGAG